MKHVRFRTEDGRGTIVKTEPRYGSPCPSVVYLVSVGKEARWYYPDGKRFPAKKTNGDKNA